MNTLNTTQTIEEVNARELAELLLTYFDSYRLGSVAPIVAELEKAFDQEYRRGVQEALDANVADEIEERKMNNLDEQQTTMIAEYLGLTEEQLKESSIENLLLSLATIAKALAEKTPQYHQLKWCVSKDGA